MYDQSLRYEKFLTREHVQGTNPHRNMYHQRKSICLDRVGSLQAIRQNTLHRYDTCILYTQDQVRNFYPAMRCLSSYCLRESRNNYLH